VEADAEYCLSSHQLVLERCKPFRSNRQDIGVTAADSSPTTPSSTSTT
jgi:hypothetical protein